MRAPGTTAPRDPPRAAPAAGAVTDADRALAAEFVLGTLDPDERGMTRARILADPHFAGLVRQWERRLSPLHELAVPVAPPPGLWRAILADLREAPPAPHSIPPREAPVVVPGPAGMQVRPVMAAAPLPGVEGGRPAPRTPRAPEGAGALGRFGRLLTRPFRRAREVPAPEGGERRRRPAAAPPAPRMPVADRRAPDFRPPGTRTLGAAIEEAVAAGFLPPGPRAPSPPAGGAAPKPVEAERVPEVRAEPEQAAAPPPPPRPRPKPEPLTPPPAFMFLEPEPPAQATEPVLVPVPDAGGGEGQDALPPAADAVGEAGREIERPAAPEDVVATPVIVGDGAAAGAPVPSPAADAAPFAAAPAPGAVSEGALPGEPSAAEASPELPAAPELPLLPAAGSLDAPPDEVAGPDSPPEMGPVTAGAVSSAEPPGEPSAAAATVELPADAAARDVAPEAAPPADVLVESGPIAGAPASADAPRQELPAEEITPELPAAVLPAAAPDAAPADTRPETAPLAAAAVPAAVPRAETGTGDLTAPAPAVETAAVSSGRQAAPAPSELPRPEPPPPELPTPAPSPSAPFPSVPFQAPASGRLPPAPGAGASPDEAPSRFGAAVPDAAPAGEAAAVPAAETPPALPRWAEAVASGAVSALPPEAAPPWPAETSTPPWPAEAPAARPDVPRASARIARWRAATALLLVVSLGLAAFVAYREWVWPRAAQWVAVLQPDALPAIAVRADPASGALFVRTFAPAPPDGETYRLWLVTRGEGAQLLGAFSAGLAVRAPALTTLRPAVLLGAELVVTLEPVARALPPGAGPGEQVVYRGRLAPE